jgi:hypothetical protein
LGTHLVGGFLFACKSAGGFWLSNSRAIFRKSNVTRDRTVVAPIMDNARKEIAMNTVEQATRETTAESLPEIGGAMVGLTILGLAGASPLFLVEIATALLCVGYLAKLVATSEPEPAFLQAHRRIRNDGA